MIRKLELGLAAAAIAAVLPFASASAATMHRPAAPPQPQVVAPDETAVSNAQLAANGAAAAANSARFEWSERTGHGGEGGGAD